MARTPLSFDAMNQRTAQGNSQAITSISRLERSLRGTVSAEQAARLFESLRPDLWRFAYWLARDRSVADDLVQEALLRAWRSRSALQDPGAARAWLLTIVRREHARLYQRKRLELVDLHQALEKEDSALAAEPADELDTLRHAILELPIKYREPLVMQVLGGFSTEEIGRELNLSQSAVITRLFRARKKLRAIYGLTPVHECRSSRETS